MRKIRDWRMSDRFRTSEKQKGTKDHIWKPLAFQKNEFRILELLEIYYEHEEPVIVASVYSVPRNAHPPYAALSYCWGITKSTKKMILNDRVHLITENLHMALLSLIAQGVMDVWVDALCIDQDNPDEKSAQVQRMASIFQEADHVMVWLGELSPRMERLMRWFSELDLQKLQPGFWGQALLEKTYNGLPKFNKGCMEFLICDYWYRTWIVQELSVAKQIMLFYGTERMDGAILESLFSMTRWQQCRTDALSQWEATSFDSYEHMVNLWSIRSSFRNRRPISLLELLFKLRGAKTSLSIDRVYAILGLVFDQRAFVAEPDYTLQPSQLSSQMTRRFIEVTGSLDIILLKQTQGFTSEHDFPSWSIPLLQYGEIVNMENNAEQDHAEMLINYIDGKSRKLRCGKLGEFWHTTTSNFSTDKKVLWRGETLEVIGLRLGEATQSSSLLDTDDVSLIDDRQTDLELLTVFDSISRLLMMYSPLYEDDHRVQDIVLLVLENALPSPKPSSSPKGTVPSGKLAKGDSPSDNNMHYRCRAILESLEIAVEFDDEVSDAILRLMLRSSRARADSKAKSKIEPEEMDLAITTILNLLCDQTYFCFLIDAENVGMMSSAPIFENTEVWLLAHCSMPVVLEKVESGSGANQSSYRFVSSALVDKAYVSGKLCSVMNGEAWNTAKPEDFERIDIV